MQIAEDIQRLLLEEMDRPWHRVVRRMSTYKLYGFSVAEWTAKKMDGGLIGMRDIAPRPQRTIERWAVDDHGNVIGCTQRHPTLGTEIELPRNKIVYAVDDTLSDSPEGLGLFRHMAKAADEVQHFERLEGWAFEADLRGVPVLRAPYGLLDGMVDAGEIDAADRTRLLASFEDFAESHIRGVKPRSLMLDSATYATEDAVARPSNVPLWDASLLEMASSTMPEMAAALTRKNHELARILGVEHLLLGQDRGTQALSRDKSDNFGLMTNGTLLEVGEVVNKDIIDTLMDLNGWDLKLKPKASPEALQFRDIEQVTGALKDLTAAALQPDDKAVDIVRDLLGLPPAPEPLELDPDASLLGGGPGNKKPNPDEPLEEDE